MSEQKILEIFEYLGERSWNVRAFYQDKRYVMRLIQPLENHTVRFPTFVAPTLDELFDLIKEDQTPPSSPYINGFLRQIVGATNSCAEFVGNFQA